MKALLLALLLLTTPATAGDLNPTHSPAISEWFQMLRQPDHPRVSCCGEADAYEADEFVSEQGELMAIITDGRGYVPNGTAIRIPKEKMPGMDTMHTRNPTGHGIVFLHIVSQRDVDDEDTSYTLADLNRILVYCYVYPNGA